MIASEYKRYADEKISQIKISHKKCLYISLQRYGNNYRFRLGLEMFRLT